MRSLMIRFVFAVLIVGSVHSLSADEEDRSNRKVPTAVVHSDKCVFVFPIEDIKKEWKWGVSPANRCEYSWMVVAKGDDANYEFGLSYFNPTSTPQSGTLDDLIFAGQCNAWKVAKGGDGGSYVDGVQVKCESVKKGLRFTIDDKEWCSKLFATKPKSVAFKTRGALLKPSEIDVKIKYKKTDE